MTVTNSYKGIGLNIKELLYIVAILLILACSGTPIQGLYYRDIVFAYLAVAIVIRFRGKGEFKIQKSTFLVWLVMVGMILLTLIVNIDFDIQHYVGLIICMTTTWLIVGSVSYQDFKRIFVKTVTVISIYSVMITIYSDINNSYPGTLPLLVNGLNSWRHIGIFYNYWGWNQWVTFVRNAACFREPGVWGAVVSLALTFKLIDMRGAAFKKNKGDFLICAILLIGGVSSFSTSAIFCLAVCVVIYLIENKGLSGGKFLILIILLIATYVLVITQYDLLFSKFNRESISYVSYDQRFSGVIAGLECWLRNPIFGSGYTYYLAHERGTSANAFIDILGKYGISIFIILVAGLAAFIKKLQVSQITRILIGLELVLMLSTQNLLVYPLYLCICFYGLNKKVKLVE